MILVLCGTSEGRLLLKALEQITTEVVATVTTPHGAECISACNCQILSGRLDEAALVELIEVSGIKYVVDITHPYAENISQLAISISGEKNIQYFRYERKTTEAAAEEVIRARDYKEAAELAAAIEGRVFLTVGSNQLPAFLNKIGIERITARVLPTSDVIKKCEGYGLTADNLIAMKGPFTTEMNIAMFKAHRAAVVVTKDSGAAGGTEEKLKACRSLGIPIIMIDRPKIDYPNTYSSLEELLNVINGLITEPSV